MPDEETSSSTITLCSLTNCSISWNEGLPISDLIQVYFWLGVVVQCVIACTGLLGNTLSVLIFTSKELRSTFHMLLVVLAFFDLGCLIPTIIEVIVYMYDYKTQGTVFPDPSYKPNVVFFYLYPKFIRPLEFICLLASEYFTVIMSLDRYYAIMYPLQYYSRFNTNCLDTTFLEQNQSFSDKNKKKQPVMKVCWQRVIWYSMLSFVFAFCYNMPIYFELNSNIENGTRTMKYTSWYDSEEYVLIYYVILDGLIKFFIPGCVLIFTNFSIYRILRKQNFSASEYSNHKRTQYVMLFGVVILLMVTNVYRFCANIHSFTIQDYLDCCPVQKDNLIAVMVGSVLRTINISANCFIYITTSYKFRQILVRKVKSMINWNM